MIHALVLLCTFARQFELSFGIMNIVTNFIFVILLFNVITNIFCEVFSSIDKLEKLASDETLIIEKLKICSSFVNDAYINR